MKLLDIIFESRERSLGENWLKVAIGGATDAKSLRAANKALYTALNDVIQFAKQDKQQLKGIVKQNQANVKTLESVDDLIKALNIPNGITPRTKGLIDQGLLKSASTDVRFMDDVAFSLVNAQDGVFISIYKKFKTEKQLRDALKAKQYSENGINAIVNATKESKSFKTAKNAWFAKQNNKVVTPKPAEPKTLLGRAAAATKEAWSATGGKLFGKTSTKVKPPASGAVSVTGKLWKGFVTGRKIFILTSLIALGYAGYVLYDLIQAGLGINPLPDLDDVDQDDVPNSVKEWKKCIIDEFEGKNNATAGADEDGGVYLQITIDEFGGKKTGGWIRFYSDYKVTTQSGETGKWECNQDAIKELNEQVGGDLEMDRDVEQMIDLLDFPVTGADLQSAHALLKKYRDNGKGKSFLSLYQRSGLGSGDLRKTLKYVVTTKATSTRLKDEMLAMISSIEGGTKSDGGGTQSDKETGGKTNTSHLTVIWDDKKSSDDGNKSGGKIKYKPCDDFPLTIGCISDKIKDIQRCLNPTSGLKVDGYYGPITNRELVKKSKFADDDKDDVTITKEIYDRIMSQCGEKVGDLRPKSDIEKKGEEALSKIEPKKIQLDTKDPDLFIDKYGMERLLNQAKKTIDGQVIQDIIDNKIKFRGGRYILKMDRELTEDQLKAINTVMKGRRYVYDDKKETLDRSKYVWVPKDRAARRVARKQEAIDKINSRNEQ